MRPQAPERGERGCRVSQAVDAWKRFVEVLTTGDVGDVLDLYSANPLYLEPYNPPHRGNLLIQSYMKDWMGGKEGVEVDEFAVIPAARRIPSFDGASRNRRSRCTTGNLIPLTKRCSPRW